MSCGSQGTDSQVLLRDRYRHLQPVPCAPPRAVAVWQGQVAFLDIDSMQERLQHEKQGVA